MAKPTKPLPKITKRDAIKALKEVVKGKEDFVYTETHSDCVYAEPNQPRPSCGVGHALYRLGVPLRTLRKLDKHIDPILEVEGSCLAKNLPKALPSVTPGAATVFQAFQRKQDSGQAWGPALTEALQEI